jgi:hypothetical protein
MAGSALGDETFHVVLYQAALALGELVKSEGGSMRLRIIFATILIVMAGCGSSQPELYQTTTFDELEEKRLSAT